MVKSFYLQLGGPGFEPASLQNKQGYCCLEISFPMELLKNGYALLFNCNSTQEKRVYLISRKKTSICKALILSPFKNGAVLRYNQWMNPGGKVLTFWPFWLSGFSGSIAMCAFENRNPSTLAVVRDVL